MLQGLRLSAMTSTDEVKKYFSGKSFHGRWDGESYEGTVASVVGLKVKATGKTYEVRVESVDDPDDSDEVSTGEPLKAIAEFLGKDIPGGEHFERMSSVPAFFAHSVAMAAELVGAGVLGRRAALRVLRRISSWSHLADSGPPGSGADLSDLEKDARKKGWKTHLKKDAHGDDVLEIDVSGIYRATVVLDAVVYEYGFSMHGEPDVGDSGTTDDPIREFEKWVQSGDVKEAYGRAQKSDKRSPEGKHDRRDPDGDRNEGRRGPERPKPDERELNNDGQTRRAPPEDSAA